MTVLTLWFGKYASTLDVSTLKNFHVMTANNIIPKADGSYDPARQLAVHSANSLGGTCVAAVYATDSFGQGFLYAGTSRKLFETGKSAGQAGGADEGDTALVKFYDESVAGGYSLTATVTATGSVNTWSFAVWNRNAKIIATNYINPVQSMTIGAGVSSAFANMITGTNVPKAKRVAVIGQFVVLGNTNDATDGMRRSRIWWSAFGNELNFDPDAATQCDFEDLSSGGAVLNVLGGNEYGLIFQRNQVQVMRYVGGGTVFAFSPLAYAPGCAFANSVVGYQGRAFYIADNGFYTIEGGQAKSIGNGVVDQEFWSYYTAALGPSISAAIDPKNKLVAWSVPDDVGGTVLFLYNYDSSSWGRIYFANTTNGFPLVSVTDASLRYMQIGTFSANFLAYFSGQSAAGVLETSDLQPVPGQRWQLNSVRPLGEKVAAAVNLNIGRRETLDSNIPTYTSGVPTVAYTEHLNGKIPVRSSANYQRLRFSLTGSTNWFSFAGVEIDYELEGEF